MTLTPADFSEIVKPGPTVPLSFGDAVLAEAVVTSAAATRAVAATSVVRTIACSFRERSGCSTGRVARRFRVRTRSGMKREV